MLQDSSELTDWQQLDIESLGDFLELILLNLGAIFASDDWTNWDEFFILVLTGLALKFNELKESVEEAIPLGHCCYPIAFILGIG